MGPEVPAEREREREREGGGGVGGMDIKAFACLLDLTEVLGCCCL